MPLRSRILIILRNNKSQGLKMIQVTDSLVEMISAQMQSVIDSFLMQCDEYRSEGDSCMAMMYYSDAEYNQKVLAKFLKDRDLNALADGIHRQDTSPREFMFDALVSVEGIV